jgi:TP53 regulating kinase-like protein
MQSSSNKVQKRYVFYSSSSYCNRKYSILIQQRVYSLASLYPAPSTYPSSTSSLSSAGPSVILKYRFPKTYRHPTLDAQLTKTRISFEARALARSLKAGIAVPKVLFVDERNGVLALEKIEGWSIREVLGGGAEGEEEDLEGEYEEGWEESEATEQREEVVSEGLEALYRIGVSKGESVPPSYSASSGIRWEMLIR